MMTRLQALLLVFLTAVSGWYGARYYQSWEMSRRIRAAQETRAARERAQAAERAALQATERAARARRMEMMGKQAWDAIVNTAHLIGETRLRGRDVRPAETGLAGARAALAAGDPDRALKLAQQVRSQLLAAPSGITYVVRRGDTLWGIARNARHYGRGSGWYRIWQANRQMVKDHDLIYPRQQLVIPVKEGA